MNDRINITLKELKMKGVDKFDKDKKGTNNNFHNVSFDGDMYGL